MWRDFNFLLKHYKLILTVVSWEDLMSEDCPRFKLYWMLDWVNIRTFCYNDFFILSYRAEIRPKMSNWAKKWELRKLRSDDIFWKMMTIGDYRSAQYVLYGGFALTPGHSVHVKIFKSLIYNSRNYKTILQVINYSNSWYIFIWKIFIFDFC